MVHYRADASGREASFALLAALLGAIGYHGLLGITVGTTELGSALPTPFYPLAFAVLFALKLVWDLREGAAGLLLATVLSAGFALLLTFAIEGVLVLAEEPSLAIDGAAGLTVLAVAIVLAFVGYWAVLSAVEWDARASAYEYTQGQVRSGSGRNQ
ncbi:hypothetical protein BRC77_09370 [Halobacteriales archaeon QH_8_64_26]|nr:MAG: hypothetical protein BRC77_09370 [Halobacteriales archaeon QH_8_64_26]